MPTVPSAPTGPIRCRLQAGDTLIVWKLDRLGRSLPHLLTIVTDLKARGIAFRSLTEQMDTTTPHGELLFSLFGALAQYERALTRERVIAGLAAARRRGRQGGRPPMIDAETLKRITAALYGGASKASVCRTFKVPRSTLLGTLARIGWTAGQRLTRCRVAPSCRMSNAWRCSRFPKTKHCSSNTGH